MKPDRKWERIDLVFGVGLEPFASVSDAVIPHMSFVTEQQQKRVSARSLSLALSARASSLMMCEASAYLPVTDDVG